MLEVLLAAAVLSVGAAIYYQAMSGALRSAGLADRRYRASLLLEKEICETELLGQPASISDKGADPALGQVQWKIDGRSDGGIKSWQVQIRWTNRGQEEELSLEALP